MRGTGRVSCLHCSNKPPQISTGFFSARETSSRQVSSGTCALSRSRLAEKPSPEHGSGESRNSNEMLRHKSDTHITLDHNSLAKTARSAPRTPVGAGKRKPPPPQQACKAENGNCSGKSVSEDDR